MHQLVICLSFVFFSTILFVSSDKRKIDVIVDEDNKQERIVALACYNYSDKEFECILNSLEIMIEYEKVNKIIKDKIRKNEELKND